jgi:subtilisin family serine protease
VPNDPLFSSQSHYSSIALEAAWEITTGSPSAVVQVLDTGLDMAHEDLQNNIWQNPGETDCSNGLDDDGNGFIDDCHGYNHADGTGTDLLGDGSHGSHCAGTIAADSNNGIGVAGVAGGDGTPGSGASLMTSVGFGSTAYGGFAEALIYGADNGAQVSSNSWGYTSPDYYEQVVLDAIDYYNSAGGIVVFAAGNDNSESCYYPGCYDGVVGVAALDDSGVRASFSNYGDWVDISAPGNPVLSTVITGEGSVDSNYAWYSGTSMACPHVAGVLALGLALAPHLTSAELVSCLTSTATNVDSINGGYAGKLGAGNVSPAAFLDCLGTQPPSTAAPTYETWPPTPLPSSVPTHRPTTSAPTYETWQPTPMRVTGADRLELVRYVARARRPRRLSRRRRPG